MSHATHRAPAGRSQSRRLAIGLLSLVTALTTIGLSLSVAEASTVSSAAFSGGAGTVSVGGTLYAKQGAALTLTVATSSDTKCVDVTGVATLPRQTSSTAKSSWTFTTTAPAGDGAQAFTVAASPNFNTNGCTGQTNSTQASYTVDNTGPVVSAGLTPAANVAGWNNSDVVVAWTATDNGSGVATSQPFQTDSAISGNGIVTKTAPAQSDRLGNTGTAGSVTVRVDKAKPTISATQTKNSDGTTTVTFTCDDGNSGGGAASGIATCVADGTSPATSSKTVQPGVTVNGTATDKAGNTATASSTAPAGDTTAPLLSGAPTTSPNGNGWYKGDVTVHWTASDPESGIPTQPADTTITGEGSALTSSQTVKNGAGLSTTATSPAVKIDRTAPTTGISGTSNSWVNGNVTVGLLATDNLSQVASTSYTVDGGAPQTGSSFTLSTNGDHTVTYFSTDKAGNAEAVQTAHVKIDQTAPTIGHTFAPLTYTDGAWTNQDVTVTFNCADQGGSGVAGCTAPVTKSVEGEYTVTGTATDNAGNSATDSAGVRIDKTAPTITATASGTKNGDGWYKGDVTVTFSANDAKSGVASVSPTKVLGEGPAQSASGTAIDKAGNSASAVVSGINVDKTAPTLTGSFAPGWHTGDVAVSWTCEDALSGPAAQPADTIVAGEGGDLSATASCTDVAGNSTTTMLSGIKIDRTAPTTTAGISGTLVKGWYNADVDLTLTGTDNLSGTTTYYTVDGGAQQMYSAAVPLAEGKHTVVYWSVDGAGNIETAGAPLTVNVDKTAPITAVVNMAPDGNNGWYIHSGIPVAFKATDGASGVAATYYTIDGNPKLTYGEPFSAELATGTHTIGYWSVDLAGNEEAHETTNVIVLKVDTVAPEITATRTPANSFGWNKGDVTVDFSCTDADSGIDGIAGCGPDQTVASEGLNQSVQGDTQDIAGNEASLTVDRINIDKTAPSLTGTPTGDSNGGEWYHGDVSIAWTGQDGLSQIDPATQPANSTVKGEGRSLGASAKISDKAGNEGTGSVTGINIDRTPLSITAQLPAGANAAGWYRGDVTVGFSCTDPNLADGSAGSGVGHCPTDAVVSGDGADQKVTSEFANDVAGNTNSKTVTGINIDGHEPQTTADNQCTATNGYCTGGTATVVLSSTDVGPSGVKEIHYTVNAGTEQVATGAKATVSVPLSGTGTASVKYYAVDVAGNVEPSQTAALKYDNIAPTVTHTVNPKANASDWNNSDVTVHFDAKDTDPGSGVDESSVTPDQVISAETSASGLAVNGSAKDTAGNTGTDSVTIKLDKTKPSVGGAIVSGTVGKNGWYVSPVKVHFTCSDALSGLASCQDDVTLSNNGPAQSASGSAKDFADNVGTGSVPNINIDNENPTISKVNVANGFYTLGSAPAATCDATDSFSGLDTCKVVVTGGTANGVGTFAWTATATDKAGNTATQSGSYKVVYKFDGFLQPINDTAHQVGTSTSVFKAGSTIPVKFQVKKADGTAVQSATAPVWLTPVKGGAMSLPVDETVQTVTADSGSTFKYDTGQYIYNWKTVTGGYYYQIGVRLDDGQTYYVNIGLR